MKDALEVVWLASKLRLKLRSGQCDCGVCARYLIMSEIPFTSKKVRFGDPQFKSTLHGSTYME